MDLTKIDKKYLWGGGVLLLIVLAFAFMPKKEQKEEEEKEVNVTVKIKDEDGKEIEYDPNDLLRRLNKGLITRYYFDFSERCDPIKELYELDAVEFMAVVKAYKTKYNTALETHMNACNVRCTIGTGETHFDLIHQRIKALKEIIN